MNTYEVTFKTFCTTTKTIKMCKVEINALSKRHAAQRCITNDPLSWVVCTVQL